MSEVSAAVICCDCKDLARIKSVLKGRKVNLEWNDGGRGIRPRTERDLHGDQSAVLRCDRAARAQRTDDV